MKKRIFALFLTAFAAVAMTACGGKEVETQEVDYDMTFENQTGMDVSELEIRYADDAAWTSIALAEDLWKNSYQMPVSMEGQMPVAEDGWQVQMTFAEDEAQMVWDGVEFEDGMTFAFSIDEDGEPVLETVVTASEGDLMETEALTDETEE